jgi:hypothetical protein
VADLDEEIARLDDVACAQAKSLTKTRTCAGRLVRDDFDAGQVLGDGRRRRTQRTKPLNSTD